jgi:hypothetical protein
MKVTAAAREWTKSIGLPAVVMALWVAAVAVLMTDVGSPVPLQAAIEEVLGASVPETDPVPLPTPQAASQANRASTPAPRSPAHS